MEFNTVVQTRFGVVSCLVVVQSQTHLFSYHQAKLKRRFDVNSEDRVGENPFEHDSLLSGSAASGNIAGGAGGGSHYSSTMSPKDTAASVSGGRLSGFSGASAQQVSPTGKGKLSTAASFLSDDTPSPVSSSVSVADIVSTVSDAGGAVNLEGSIFQYGGSEEQFDFILSELEREIELKAQSKRANSKICSGSGEGNVDGEGSNLEGKVH